MSETPSPPSAGDAALGHYLSEQCPVQSWERAQCPGACKANKKFYCSACQKWVGVPAEVQAPNLKLPVKVDVIMADHRKRSTGVHAAVVAPESCRVLDYPHEMASEGERWDARNTYVLFPSSDALTLDQLSESDLQKLETLVLIDSRWNNTKRVLESPAIAKLRTIKLKYPPSETRFWRWHCEGKGHVSSIEALYYVLREFEAASGRRADGRLEDLLYIFRLQTQIIKDSYSTSEEKKGRPLPMDEASKRQLREKQCPGSKKLKRLMAEEVQQGAQRGREEETDGEIVAESVTEQVEVASEDGTSGASAKYRA